MPIPGNASNLYIKNETRVEEIIKNITQGGITQLQIVTDFDRTLTKTNENGEPLDCSWGVLERNGEILGKFTQEAQLLFEKYHPIEINPFMKQNEKIPYMLEWYHKCHDNLVISKLKKKDISFMVSNSKLKLKDGIPEMFNLLHSHNIPVLVFSAGLGDIIVEVLNQYQLLHSNIHVISNFMDFDNNGCLIGFQNDIIHMFNKTADSARTAEYFQQILEKHNIILLGDSLGDINMINGISNINNVLKLGFLNYKIEEHLKEYAAEFDIILLDDQTFNVPLDILKYIIFNKLN